MHPDRSNRDLLLTAERQFVRDRIFREIFEQFWQFAQCMPERNSHSLNAGWRLIVEDWLHRQRWITVRDNNQQKVSTNSKGFFSQN